MISSEERARIKEAARWMTVTQVATQFKVSRNVVINIKKGGEPKKSLEWEPKRKSIAEDSKTMSAKELAEKHGVGLSRIYAVLKRERGK